MAISSANAAAGPKVRKVETLTSGTSWTVPTGVEFVNATLIGAGGGGGSGNDAGMGGGMGGGGQIIETTVTTTPGASITYAIGSGGAGGNAGSPGGSGSAGGSTTFTGATTALGGVGGQTGGNGSPSAQRQGLLAVNGGLGTGVYGTGGTGGAGQIILEYWV